MMMDPAQITTLAELTEHWAQVPQHLRSNTLARVLRNTPPENWPNPLPWPLSKSTLRSIHIHHQQGTVHPHDHAAKARAEISKDPYADTVKNLARKYDVSEGFISEIRTQLKRDKNQCWPTY